MSCWAVGLLSSLTHDAVPAVEEAQELVKNSKSVAEILGTDVEHYDALFIPGGHGIVWVAAASPQREPAVVLD
jgi:putative intracellular protease/amidase